MPAEEAAVSRHVAFLRAINVGGHVVKMDRLRTLFEKIGLDGVGTFIASGNVLFDSAEPPDRLEMTIERHLAASLGYEVATFIRSAAELRAIAERVAAPDIARADATVYVGFLKSPPDAAAKRALLNAGTETNAFVVDGREVYWRCHTRMSDSPFSGAWLEKTLATATTMRNLNTVHRLIQRLPS